MAPEVIKSNGHGWYADIWSVGCTVIEMLSGNPPFKDCKNEFQAMNAIATSKSPPPYPNNISPDLKDLLNKCFKIKPKERGNAYQLLHHKFFVGN